MTRKAILRMARESRIDVYGLGADHEKFASALERFFQAAYAVGAAAEREQCAKLLEDNCNYCSGGHLQEILLLNAAAIRARKD